MRHPTGRAPSRMTWPRTIRLDTVRSKGYAFQVELTYRAVRSGYRVVEVPITFRDRRAGRSKMSWRIAGEAVLLVPRLRRHYTLYSEQQPRQEMSTLKD